MLRSSEALNVLTERDNGTLLQELDNLTLVDRTNGVLLLEYIPRIVLQLLVAKAETTVLLVDIQNDNVNLCTNLSELRRMLNLLSPREVADVNQTVNTLFELNEYTEVSEVANLSGVLAANRILNLDSLPGIFLQLLDAEKTSCARRGRESG